MSLMKELKMVPAAGGGHTMYEGRLFPGIIAHLIKLKGGRRAGYEDRNAGTTVYNTFCLRKNALIFIKENAA